MDIDRILAKYPAARVRLIRAREAWDMHPREAAEQLNISYPYYRGIELGVVEPEDELAQRLAALLGVDAGILMKGGAA